MRSPGPLHSSLFLSPSFPSRRERAQSAAPARAGSARPGRGARRFVHPADRTRRGRRAGAGLGSSRAGERGGSTACDLAWGNGSFARAATGAAAWCRPRNTGRDRADDSDPHPFPGGPWAVRERGPRTVPHRESARRRPRPAFAASEKKRPAALADSRPSFIPSRHRACPGRSAAGRCGVAATAGLRAQSSLIGQESIVQSLVFASLQARELETGVFAGQRFRPG